MRLRTYTLHVSEGALRGDGRALDAAEIVADGFSWPAFAFSVLWFLRHRLWLAALFVLALLAGLFVAGHWLGLTLVSGIVIAVLASVLTGLEASSLRRWTYARTGRPARDAVVAESRDEAEAKLVVRWLDPATPRATPAYGRRSDAALVGMLPFGEGGR